MKQLLIISSLHHLYSTYNTYLATDYSPFHNSLPLYSVHLNTKILVYNYEMRCIFRRTKSLFRNKKKIIGKKYFSCFATLKSTKRVKFFFFVKISFAFY